MAWIIPAISAITGLISQSNAQRAAQQAAQEQGQANAQAAHALQVTSDAAKQQYGQLMQLAQQIMANPMSSPLGPIINAIMNNYRNAGLSQISSAMNQLGPGMANPSGSLQDMMNALLTGGANYASQAMGTASQDALGMYQTGAEGFANTELAEGRGLAGIWGPGGASTQYQQIGQQIAQNLAQQPSPFAALMSWLQSPEGSAAASRFFTRMFPGPSANMLPGSATGADTTPDISPAAANRAGLSSFTPQQPQPLYSNPGANLYVPGGGIGG